MQTVLIYSPIITSRLQYITREIFNSVLGIQPELTASKDFFTAFAGPKINYSSCLIQHCLSIYPCGLLEKSGVMNVYPEVRKDKPFPVLFPVNQEGFLSFDPFAATFYLLTRYEEYLPFRPDRHGRFEPPESLAWKHGFLSRPLVNEWCNYLLERMIAIWPWIKSSTSSFRFQPTIDIDAAWFLKNKGVIRSLAAGMRDIVSGKPDRFILRNRVIFGHADDPYDNFSWINSIHDSAGLSPVWFFLTGPYGRHDPNNSIHHPAMRELVKACMQKGEVGIHPSYASHLKYLAMHRQLQILSLVTDVAIIKSRQHYLRIKFPDTYRYLIQLGITDDYSMGYASQPGFRASTCTPFRFYDLMREEETSLTIHPFQVMERTFSDYLHMPYDEALHTMLQIAEKVKKYKGEFVSIFHNETLEEEKQKHGWRSVYNELVQTISK